jgi:endonuclease-3
VGTWPEQILNAPDAALSGGGILTELRPARLREIARLTLEEFDGDLDSLRSLPLRQAKRALMRFPSIGEPGAEKILLFARSYAVFGLDSNGVRALTRLGLVREGGSYSATYRSVQSFAAPYLELGVEWLIRGHQLLRQHGQNLCRRTNPQCGRCPLSDICAYYLAGPGRAP